MAERTGIAWTGATWTPIRARHRVTGKVGWYCQRISEGCRHCYASTMNSWRGNGVDYTVPALADVELFLDERILAAPLSWRTPRRIFVCSMTDLFGAWAPDEWIDRIFAVMALAPWHTFQVLTKRQERMLAWFSEWRKPNGGSEPRWCAVSDTEQRDHGRRAGGGWPLPHVQCGVSVEDRKTLNRLDVLRQTPATLRFVSFEPLLEDLGAINLDGIGWAILGGESGPSARPCDLAWIRSAVAQCLAAGTACFVKQLGARPFTDSDMGMYGWPPHVTFTPIQDGALAEVRLHQRAGADPSEWPEDLRVQEWPR